MALRFGCRSTAWLVARGGGRGAVGSLASGRMVAVVDRSMSARSSFSCYRRQNCVRAFTTASESTAGLADAGSKEADHAAGSDSPVPEAKPSTLQRLSKIMATTGICSRREAENWIKAGRVQVDGVECKSVTLVLDTAKNPSIFVDGVKLARNKVVTAPKLWAVYKARGELTADNDPLKNRKLMLGRLEQTLTKTIPDPLAETLGSGLLKPINRLDYNTEGICMVTNNGALARTIGEMSDLKKEYRVRIHGLLTDDKIDGLKRGVFMKGKRQKPMSVTVENSAGTNTWLKIVTSESSNRTVYDCLRQLHLDVTRMISVAYGPYKLTSIPPQIGWLEVKLTPELSQAFYSRHIKSSNNSNTSGNSSKTNSHGSRSSNNKFSSKLKTSATRERTEPRKEVF